MQNLAQRCAVVELLVLDVDGVLTDGSIVYGGADVELKTFHVRDGTGLKCWRDAGKRAAIISGRSSSTTARRASELGIDFVVQGAADKQEALRSILAASGLEPGQTAAIGDDLADLSVLESVGLAVAVADACAEMRAAAHYVTERPGGRGAVREAIELVLRCQGKWHSVVDKITGRGQSCVDS